jgi:hypothetical protein
MNGAQSRTAAPRKHSEKPSVRAGTDKAKSKEGELEGSAARRSNCHAGTHSTERSLVCAKHGGIVITAVGSNAQTYKTTVAASGADTLISELASLSEPFSNSAQPSRAESVRLSAQQEPSGPCCSGAKRPDASNAQCCAVVSQPANSRSVVAQRRKLTRSPLFAQASLSIPRSLLHLRDILQHFIGGLDRLGIYFVGALGDNEVHHFFDYIHVRALGVALHDTTE